MRITINITAEKSIILPIHYNHILQGFLYSNLSDKNYSLFIHSQGFQIGNKQFKLFTYSNLRGKFILHRQFKQIEFLPPIKLIISSAAEPFITDLAETLIKKEFNYLGNNIVQIDGIKVHKENTFSDLLQIKMLSPVIAYKTVIGEQRKKTLYFSPWEKLGKEIIINNLLTKYQLIYGQLPKNSEFDIIPNGNQQEKFVRIIDYKGTYIKGYAGIYWLNGNPDLIKVAYDTGLGSKNSQGFGCWEAV